jgi:hypothetical protein
MLGQSGTINMLNSSPRGSEHMANEDFYIKGTHNIITDRRTEARRFGRRRQPKGIIAVQCAIMVRFPELHEVIEEILLHGAYQMDVDGEQVNVGAASAVRANAWKCNLWVSSDDVSIQGLTRKEAEAVPNGILAALSRTLIWGWGQAGLQVTAPRKPYELVLIGLM